MKEDVLMQFCDPKPNRYDLSTPWVVAGWRYATDGRIIVRVRTKAKDTQGGGKRPDATELFPKPFPRCSVPWPHHDGKMKLPECRICEGTGKTGETQCYDCGGELQILVIGGRFITGELCMRIQAIGEVRYSAKGGKDDNLCFACGKLQGVVAPLDMGKKNDAAQR